MRGPQRHRAFARHRVGGLRLAFGLAAVPGSIPTAMAATAVGLHRATLLEDVQHAAPRAGTSETRLRRLQGHLRHRGRPWYHHSVVHDAAAGADSAGSSRPLPLAGIRVIDLGNIYNGPYCGFLFAQAGADVVKVEAPSGDGARGLSGAGSKMTSQLRYAFENLNAGKRLIALDLKSAVGRDSLLALVEKADVLFDNFSPGTLDRLGLGPKVLHQRNPRLVYGQATGYGTVSSI